MTLEVAQITKTTSKKNEKSTNIYSKPMNICMVRCGCSLHVKHDGKTNFDMLYIYLYGSSLINVDKVL